MKKLIALTVAINLFFYLNFNITAFSADILYVADADDLVSIGTLVNSGDSCEGKMIVLTGDIELNGIKWEPIGTKETPFAGSFDGAGYSITGFNEVVPGEYSGVFGYSKGSISGLSVYTDGLEITSTGHIYGGLICGYSTGSISGCKAEGVLSVSADNYFVYSGGICGYSSGTVYDCSFSGEVSSLPDAGYGDYKSEAFSGGIAGINKGQITSCYADAVSNAESNFSTAGAGGIAGKNNGIISGSESSGAVSSLCRWSMDKSYSYAGGICACNLGTINNCISDAEVSSNFDISSDIVRNISCDAGGIAGYNSGCVNNCAASGSVTALFAYSSLQESNAGGIVGCNLKDIKNCTSTAKIKNTSRNGGGIAGKSFGGSIISCKNYGTVSAAYNSEEIFIGGIVGMLEEGLTQRCFSDGALSVDLSLQSPSNAAGAIVGMNKNGFVSDCCAGVNCSVSAYISSGIAGLNGGILNNSYTVAGIKGTKKYSFSSDGGVIQYCYTSQRITGATDSIGFSNVSFANLKKQETFQNWDFSGIWSIEEGVGYPSLKDDIILTFSGGNGSADNPYIIKTVMDLYNVRYAPDASYVLMNNIVMEREWTPICNSANTPFTGTFDGNGFEIFGISISGNMKYAGLFGYIKEACIKNLSLGAALNINAETSFGSTAYAGVLAGYAENSVIEGVCADAEISLSGIKCNSGGIAGFASGSITGCSFSGTVYSYSDCESANVRSGGIAGFANGTIENCAVKGEVTAVSEQTEFFPYVYSGGIVSGNVGKISSCVSDALITADGGSNSCAGGVCGISDGDIDNASASSDTVCGYQYNGYQSNTASSEQYNESSIKERRLVSENRNYPLIINNEGGIDTARAVITPREGGYVDISSNTVGQIYVDFGSGKTEYISAVKTASGSKIDIYTKIDGTDYFIGSYTSDFSDGMPIQLSSAVIENGKLSFKAVSGQEMNVDFYVTFYDADKNMIKADLKSVHTVEGENIVEFENIVIDNGVQTIRIFSWNSELKPYCVDYTVYERGGTSDV